MERINEDAIDLIDLGAASVETKGNSGLDYELIGTQKATGLSDED